MKHRGSDPAERKPTESALSGLLIADFGRVLAGPYATMLLADLGAEVVKIERPGSGDDTRAWGPPWQDGQATYFQGVNRNKSSVVADLTTDEGRAAARALASRADIVVENFRPGVMERLGLGYDELRDLNPRLVYCSITGFGSAAGADLPGYDLLVQAMGGLMSITGDPDGGPTKVGVALVDVITGLHAAVGILAAARHAASTGAGQRVEVNLLSSLLSALVNQAQGYVGAGVVPGRMGNRHPSIAPYEAFATEDRMLVLAVGTDRQFAALCDVLALPEVARDPRFTTNEQRVANREELRTLLEDRLGREPAEHWFKVLMDQGVPCGPINTIDQGFSLAAELGLDPVVHVPRVAMRTPDLGQDGAVNSATVATVAHPIRLSRTPAVYRAVPPQLGQDGQAGVHRDHGDWGTAASCESPGVSS